jgi:hypothetical protein
MKVEYMHNTARLIAERELIALDGGLAVSA